MGYYLRGNETFAPSTVRAKGWRNRGGIKGQCPLATPHLYLKNPFPSIGLLFLCAPHPHKFSSLRPALSVKCMYPRLKSFTTETALTEKVMETKEML